MNKPETLLLLKGDLAPEEAREVLVSLFQTKVHYHQMRNFSSQERFGCDDKVSAERIPELMTSLHQIQDLVARAEALDQRMIVTSTVSIEFVDAGQ